MDHALRSTCEMRKLVPMVEPTYDICSTSIIFVNHSGRGEKRRPILIAQLATGHKRSARFTLCMIYPCSWSIFDELSISGQWNSEENAFYCAGSKKMVAIYYLQ